MAKKVIPEFEEEKQLQNKKNECKTSEAEKNMYESGEYEVTPDEDFKINIHMKKVDKRWVIVRSEDEADISHFVVFRMWTYGEEIELRKQATSFDAIKRMHLIDNDELNKLKLRKLLKAWTLDKDNPRLELNHINGYIPDEVFGRIMKLHPNILKYIVEQMNAVLEYNA